MTEFLVELSILFNDKLTVQSLSPHAVLHMYFTHYFVSLCLAEDPSAVYRHRGGSSSTSWRSLGRKCGWMFWRSHRLWPSIVLWPFRVRAGYSWHVWWFWGFVLQCLPWEDTQDLWLCKEATSIPAVPLSEPLESFWWWLQGFFSTDHEGSNKVDAPWFPIQIVIN